MELRLVVENADLQNECFYSPCLFINLSVPALEKYYFFLIFDPLLPTGCRCEGYCCTWLYSVALPHSVGLDCTRDRPVAEQRLLPHNTQHSQETFMPKTGFEQAIPSNWAAAEPRLIPSGHRVRHLCILRTFLPCGRPRCAVRTFDYLHAVGFSAPYCRECI